MKPASAARWGGAVPDGQGGGELESDLRRLFLCPLSDRTGISQYLNTCPLITT